MRGQALMVIDVQDGLFQGTPGPYDATSVLARINDLSTRARAAGVPVIFIQHDGTAEEGLEPGSPGWQLHRNLLREPTDLVVRKTACDAFYRSTLIDALGRAGVREIVATGFATEFCVETTVRRAASEGFDVVLVSDGHTTSDRPVFPAWQVIAHHNWVLANLVQPDNPVRVRPAREVEF
jgi:nicotinamidase-related amidase